ncbi:hypothetical protein [Enterococcus sp.]|uniref:hypothetical protein n=1 Tax=Enterococcus sp. TaxID=35783 RepID=UPI003C74057B
MDKLQQQSPIVKILAFIGFLLVASFLLNLVGGLIGLVFRWAIPVAIVYFIYRWLTNRSQSNNHYTR